MTAKRVIFEGRVQGVGFRYMVKDIARGFDVCGWVKNLADGSVELQAAGDPEEVDGFLHEITGESPLARNIKRHTVETIANPELRSGFRIERSD